AADDRARPVDGLLAPGTLTWRAPRDPRRRRPPSLRRWLFRPRLLRPQPGQPGRSPGRPRRNGARDPFRRMARGPGERPRAPHLAAVGPPPGGPGAPGPARGIDAARAPARHARRQVRVRAPAGPDVARPRSRRV